MKKLLKVVNDNYGEEEVLYELNNEGCLEEIISGDQYHDKIFEYIDGFLHCLDYAEIDYSYEVAGVDDLLPCTDWECRSATDLTQEEKDILIKKYFK